jgi:hypothetical protein
MNKSLHNLLEVTVILGVVHLYRNEDHVMKSQVHELQKPVLLIYANKKLYKKTTLKHSQQEREKAKTYRTRQ